MHLMKYAEAAGISNNTPAHFFLKNNKKKKIKSVGREKFSMREEQEEKEKE